MKRILITLLMMSAFATTANAAVDVGNQMIAVSADIVEISGTIQKTRGFQWNTFYDFTESSIKGIVKLGDFQRSTALSASLKLLETESKAQTLANPKIITKNGEQAVIDVGGDVPAVYATQGGQGTDFKSYGITLQVLPTIMTEAHLRGYVDISLGVSVSAPDYSRTAVVNATTVPSFTRRSIETHVLLKSGETIVIGGLKRSNYNIAKNRVPVLGSLPLIGKLFTSTDILEEQSSLFLFVTFDIIK